MEYEKGRAQPHKISKHIISPEPLGQCPYTQRGYWSKKPQSCSLDWGESLLPIPIPIALSQLQFVTFLLMTCLQGLRENFFQGIRRSIPGPQILLGAPEASSGPMPLNHFFVGWA